jgi:hypothetical protein
VQHVVAEAIGYRSTGHSMLFGDNRPYGALLSVWVGDSSTEQVTVEVNNAAGDLIRMFTDSVEIGVNRTTWDLRRTGFKTATASDTMTGSGPEVLPGRYSLRVIAGNDTTRGAVEVHADPRVDVAAGDRELKLATMLSVGQRIEVATEAIVRIRSIRDGVDKVLEVLEESEYGVSPSLREEATGLKTTLDTLCSRFITPSGERSSRQSPPVLTRLQRVYSSLGSSGDAPTEAQQLSLGWAETALEDALADLNRVLADDVAPFRSLLAESGLELVPDVRGLDIDWIPESAGR